MDRHFYCPVSKYVLGTDATAASFRCMTEFSIIRPVIAFAALAVLMFVVGTALQILAGPEDHAQDATAEFRNV